jgi:Fe-S-cluster containining protein
MTETLRAGLPRIYERILPPFFDTPAPEEPKATCSSCAMGPPAAPIAGVTYFRPDTKCCTYQPAVPNYLVGAILSDDDPAMAEGRRRIRAHIATRVGVTSRWLSPSRKRLALFNAARESSFGRSLVLRCPYYEADGGLCTIWRHRESVCSTFFCKYAAGADGQTFWRALEWYLRQIERGLARHAVQVLAPSLVEPQRPVHQMSLEELEDRPPSDADYASFWGEWQGREVELYQTTYEITAGLTQDDALRIAGAGEELRALEAAYERLRAPVLPDKLRLDLYRAPLSTDDGVIVGSYSAYEPIKLTPALFEVLRELRTDETVAEYRARMLREHEVDVPEEMLLELHRLRVLVQA